MQNVKFRKSIHSQEHLTLRNFWINQRQSLNLSQRALAEKLNITYSLIGKIANAGKEYGYYLYFVV